MKQRARIALVGATCALALLADAGAAAAACPNESSRVGASAALPDCRAFELVTPGLDGVAPPTWPALSVQGVRADAGALAFTVAGVPGAAEGSTSATATILASRGVGGWSTKSLSAPTPLPSGTFFGAAPSTLGVSEDLTQSLLYSNQPLAGPGSPTGANAYLRRADGSVAPVTEVGAAGFDPSATLSGASVDFSRIFLATTVKQNAEDPLLNGNTYEYSAGHLHLVPILPPAVPAGPEEAAPAGGALAPGALPAVSGAGTQALFKATLFPGLYLRSGGTSTVEVSKSQRGTPDPNPPAEAISAGISADGRTVLFTSANELTEDADTGESAGVPTDAGADLYSYDVATGVLTDLTVDTNPADVATGADVEAVLGASPDASYVYFVARDDLAPGATSGARNLYVTHAGAIRFVAADPVPGEHFYVTPDGLHAAFTSAATQGAYDNAGFAEVYRYSYGGPLECGSCRPGGEAPEAGAQIVGRALSDDGSRLFFQSADQIVPAAQSGRSNVFAYEGGAVHLLTPGDGAAAVLAGAGASGDDVFIATFQELSPQGQGPVFAIYDARVDAEVPVVATTPGCQGEGCRGAPPASPGFPGAGTAGFEAPGRISAPALKVVKGSKVALRVIVPGAGQLSVVGRGLRALKTQPTKAGATTITLALKPGAERKRRKQGVFRTEAEILFRTVAGEVSRADVELAFEGARRKTASPRKGHR
jgi:hypothetical protein